MSSQASSAAKPKRSLGVEFVLGALASCGAVTVSNPMEVVKTRLQLQGELQKSGVYVKQYKGLGHAFTTILRLEGIRGIQRGLFLAYPYTTLMNGTRLGLYEHGKSTMSKITGLSNTNILCGMVSGIISGVTGSILANPFYIAKTRLQSYSPYLPVGHQHNYKGALGALTSIYKEDGIRGLFRGTKAACIRMTVASPVQLVSYDITKRAVLKTGAQDGMAVHLTSSVIASIFLALALNPFDVVTTRLYNQKVENGRGTLYSGWTDCFVKVSRTEGLGGLYKGLVPHYARLAPHTVLIFVLLEQLRKQADRLNIY